MNVKSAPVFLLIAFVVLCSPAAHAGKQHSFGGASGGDVMTVSFYLVNPTSSTVWAAVDGGAASQVSQESGFVQISNLVNPGTHTIDFSYGPTSSQRTEIETDTVTFASDGDPNDQNIYFYWPYSVNVDTVISLPYDWHVTSGETYSALTQINNAGTAVGYLDEGGDKNDDLAITYAVGAQDTQTNISSLLGGANNQADAVNNNGDIAAIEDDQDYPNDRGVLLPLGGSATAMDPNHPFTPQAINAQRMVVGYGGAGDEACVYVNGVFTDLQATNDFPSGTTYSYAYGVNDANIACGVYYDSDSVAHAFTWSPGATAVTTLLMPDPYVSASAASINQQGLVVGYASDGSRVHAVLWKTDGSVLDLGTLNSGGGDVPASINDLGQVLGYEGNDPWVWDPYLGIKALSSVTSVYPPSPGGINDLGEIMGSDYPIGTDFNNNEVYAGMVLSTSVLSDQRFGDVNAQGGSIADPTGSAWSFTGLSGIAANGSTYGNEGWPGAPCGSQFAYLESANNQGGQISQTITIPANGGYAFSFFAMQRDRAGRENTASQSFRVTVDGQTLGTYTPQVGSWYALDPRTPYTVAYETDPVELTAGTHTLTFTSDAAPSGTDNTALINGVSVSLSHPAVILAPQTAEVSGSAFSVTGTVYGADGSRIANTPLAVRLTGPGSLASGSTNTTTASDGTFTFSGLTINTTGSGYAFTVTAPNVPVNTFTTTVPFSVYPQPTITSISPTTGPVGTIVTITGTNFDAVTRVRFHNASGTYTVNSPTQITVSVPSGAGTGTITVNEPGTAALSAQTFTVVPAPTVTSISPTTGPVGTTVVITGTNFDAVTRVRFHNASATYTVNSSSQITCTVPSGAGTGTITVNESNIAALSPQTFTVVPAPAISSISPTAGPIGTTVVITGTNFVGVTRVRFHNASATYTVNSPTQITCTVPSGAGTGTITVNESNVAAISAQTFTVLPQPTITSIAPASGPVGTVITITGANFDDVTRVRFHNASAVTYSINAAKTQITVTVPSGAGTGTITVNEPGITVTSSQTFTVSM